MRPLMFGFDIYESQLFSLSVVFYEGGQRSFSHCSIALKPDLC
jgi:hypothetical protein